MRGLLMALGVAVLVATPALAHGPVGAEPGPGTTVGGVITEIRIVFPELMTDEGLTLVLTDPDGRAIDAIEGPFLDDDRQVVRMTIAPLDRPGPHRVDYSVGGVDGVRTPGAYQFVLDPAAPPPTAVSVPEPVLTATGPNWRAFSLGMVAAAVLVGFVLRIRRNRG